MRYVAFYESPIQTLRLVSNGRSLVGLYLLSDKHSQVCHRNGDGDWQENETVDPFPEAKQQLAAYFAGTLTAFDLPLHMTGTAFQQKVWAVLNTIPYGTTLSYGALAQLIGQPTASRAVGLANGRNPVSIVVPCHRVIGASGRLTGYGGGMERKQWLLNHESLTRMNLSSGDTASFMADATKPDL